MERDKRGGTHIGFVLSFVIFIIFIVVVYSVLIVPNLNQSDKRALVENLKIRLLENVSDELTSIAINTESAPQNCIKLSGFMGSFDIGQNVIAKDASGIGKTAYVLGNDLEISRNDNGTFFKIFESSKFGAASAVGETPCNPRNYEAGIAKKDRYIFEKSVVDLMGYYENNYENLRQEFGFPEDSDFDFGFTYSNGTYVKVERKTTSSIYSSEMPIEYVDGNASILSGFVNVRVW